MSKLKRRQNPQVTKLELAAHVVVDFDFGGGEGAVDASRKWEKMGCRRAQQGRAAGLGGAWRRDRFGRYLGNGFGRDKIGREDDPSRLSQA